MKLPLLKTRSRMSRLWALRIFITASFTVVAAPPVSADELYMHRGKDGTLSFSNAPAESGYEAHTLSGRASGNSARRPDSVGDAGPAPDNSAAEAAPLTDLDATYAKAKDLTDRYRGDGKMLKQAEHYLRQILNADPKYALAYVGLARVTAKSGYVGSGGYDPGSVSAALRSESVGNGGYDPGILGAARRYVDRALEITPDLFDAYVERGYLCNFASDFAGATKAAQEAEQRRPGTAEVALLRAFIAQAQFNPGEGTRQAEAALKATNNANIRAQAYHLIAAMHSFGEPATADAAYRKMLEVDSSAWAKDSYAQFLIRQSKYDQAIELSKSALAEMDFGVGRRTLAYAYVKKADAAIQNGQAPEALHYCELAQQAAPGDTKVYTGLYSVYNDIAKQANNPELSRKAKEAAAELGAAQARDEQLAKQALDGRPVAAQVEALLRDLGSSAYRTRWQAAEELGKIIPQPQAALPALLKAAADDSTEIVRTSALAAALRIAPQDSAVLRALGDALHDKGRVVRDNAARLAIRIGAPMVPAVVEALTHEDPLVRIDAALTLAEMGANAQGAVPALSRALGDRDSYVRRYAARALAAIGPAAEPAVPALTKALEEPGPVQTEAITALQRIGTPEAQSALDRFRQQHQASR